MPLHFPVSHSFPNPSAYPPRILASISTASANSSGHRRFASTHLQQDWKGQATQAARSNGLP